MLPVAVMFIAIGGSLLGLSFLYEPDSYGPLFFLSLVGFCFGGWYLGVWMTERERR